MIHLAEALSPLAHLGLGYGMGLLCGAVLGFLLALAVLRWVEP